MSKIKLFCFPYAGGSAVIYLKWRQYLNKGIELIPIELAGRGKRIHEPLYTDVEAMINDVYEIVYPQIDECQFALFGHSMGGMVAYYLAHKLIKTNSLLPLHLFISGRGAPHVKRSGEKKMHLLDKSQFINEVIDLGGTSSEVFQHQELVETFLPVLRNDFKLAETDFDDKITSLNVDITVLLGEEEELTISQSMGWKKHTTKKCDFHYFNGGHFYLYDQISQITSAINQTFSAKNVLKNDYQNRAGNHDYGHSL